MGGLVKSRAGWNLIEIAALVALAGIVLLALFSLFAERGLGAFRILGRILLVGVPLLGFIIWRNERENRRLRERLRTLSEEERGGR